MRFLRTNTAIRVTVGPFFDKTDGVTPETGITVTSCKLTFMVDDANVPTLVLDTAPTASGGANDMVHVTGDDAGFYDLELAAANVNYLGRAMLAITDAATHCPVFHEFMILPANVYDSLVLGTDLVDVSVTQLAGSAIDQAAGLINANVKQISGDATAADNEESFFDGTGYAGTGNVIPSVTTVTGNVNGSVGSVTGAVGSVTGAVGSVTGAVGSVTGAVGSVGAGGIAAASFAAGAIDAAAIAANAIGASEIADGAIDAGALAADCITAAKIADGAIDAATFAAGAIDATAIAANAIGASEPAADAVAEIAVGVRDEATSGHTTAGTYGDKLGAHIAAVLKAITAAGGTTTTIVLNAATGIDGAAPSATDDFYNGRVFVFTSGALAGQATSITDYAGASQTLTVVALTGAPAAAVTGVIV